MINLLLVIAVTLWGLSFIGTKMALEYLTPVEIIAVRLLLGTPVLYAVIRLKGIEIQFRKADYIVIVPASIILGGHFVIQALGLIYTTATNTAWLIATIPIFIAVMSRIFLKERLTRQKILGIALATLGVILLVSRGRWADLDWLNSVGDWIILSSCITWSVYTIITRNITRSHSPLTLIFSILLLPAVLLPLYTVISTPITKFAELPPSIVGILIFLGVFCLGIAHWLWLEGLSKKGATEVGVFLYFEPVVTTLAAIPILGEGMTVFALSGAVLILAGVYMVERRKRTRVVTPG
jgi:drug/metabolite transporter (DMT)-like permease